MNNLVLKTIIRFYNRIKYIYTLFIVLFITSLSLFLSLLYFNYSFYFLMDIPFSHPENLNKFICIIYEKQSVLKTS